MKTKLLVALCSSLFISACQITDNKNAKSSADTNKVNTKEVISQYMTAYALHEDFDYFMSFYAENAQLEDVIRGKKVKGKLQIRELFNWHDPKLSLGNSVSAVVVEQIKVFENSAVVTGFFMPFVYDGLKFGPWKMTMLLTLNENGKIIEQTDWINYTPKVLFSNDPDSNLTISVPKYLLK
ncbi:hypothetical protein [Catenovulum agarivorans]|uniref:hypothetical protein n=1 Tax=Catenovulum agarivorans TaxID=1172192 RepID=UPI0012FAEF8D|nr:hypothetical protein [Catenovulum agarivorans]